LPLLSAPEADSPIYVAGTNAYLVTDGGLVPLTTATDGSSPEIETNAGDGQNNPAALDTEAETPKDSPDKAQVVDEVDEVKDKVKAAQAEVKAFIKWVRKSPTRNFVFENLPKVYGETLNKFVDVGDYDGARWYAERYLG
jgi:hypothetical protein